MAHDLLTNVPSARMQMFGRGAAVTVLAQRVCTAPGGAITITGPGGVGKTSLAVAVARAVMPDFAHGVWLADLSAVTAQDAIPRAIAQALGVREGHGAPVAEAVMAFLRDRRVLLLLDNCEHLIDACATVAIALLDRCPHLRILATSREPLRIDGEVTYPLPPLPVPPPVPGIDLDSLNANASVALFLDRARAVRPDFTLTARNAATVAAVCRRLDGIPLALELAATRLGGLTLDQLAARLRGDFAVLASPGRSRPARQQTLHAALEWSHALLDPAEQAVFRRLGAFAGGWTLPAAESVCAGDDVPEAAIADVLAGLVEKSLVVLEEYDGEARYRFLEPVRAYALERLIASPEWETTCNRHRAFFVRLAEQAEPEVHRAQQADWLRRLDRDLDNLRLAVRTAQTRSDAESVLRLAGALWGYLWLRGHLREGLQWLEPALDQGSASGPARFAGLRAAAMLLGALGRSTEAEARAEELLTCAQQVGDRSAAAHGAMLLGMEWFRRGDLDHARPLFEQALADGRAAGQPFQIGSALVNLGQVVRQTGDTERAEALYRHGLAQYEGEGDLWGIAYAANNLAYLLLQRGEQDQAARLSAQAVRLLSGLGDRFYLIFAVEDLARARARAGRQRAAARLFGAAHTLRLATGAVVPPGGQVEYERELGAVRAALGAPEFAEAWREGEQRPLAALAEETAPRPPQSTAPVPPAPFSGPGGSLTPRELEVARLIGQGYSNRQIAEKLVITPGTAGVHVEHILRKLDLRSRHQVAEWVRARGLLTA